jgi:hypothetical protein
MSRRRTWAAVIAVASLTLGTTAVLPTATAQATACPIGWGSLAKTDPDHTVKPLTNVRTGRHNCHDRMVIDVPGAKASSLGYSVRYVSKFVQDGSGQVIPVPGGAILKIIVQAPAYNIDTGKPTYPAKPGRTLPRVNLNGYRSFRAAKYGGSFEGQAQFAVGVRARLPFRIMVLNGRIVVDVAHDWQGN